jgi:hypothetical protein
MGFGVFTKIPMSGVNLPWPAQVNVVPIIHIGQKRFQHTLLASCTFWWLSTCLKVWKHKAPTFKRCTVLSLLFSMLMTQWPHAIQLIRTLSCGCGHKTLWIRKDSSLVNFAEWVTHLWNLLSLSSSHIQCTHTKTTNDFSQNWVWWASHFYVRWCMQKHVSCTSLQPTICQRVRLLPNRLGAYCREVGYSRK